MLNAVVVCRPLPTSPVVVRRPISRAVVVRCRRPPPSSAAIAVVVHRRCLPLPPSSPQPSSPLRCLRRLSPPALVLPPHSLPPRSHKPSSSAAVVVCHCRSPPSPSLSAAAVFHPCSHHRHSAVSGVSRHCRPFPIVVRHPILRAFVIHRRPSPQLLPLPLPLLVDCCLCPPPSLSPPLSSSRNFAFLRF